jgi:cyclopropane fatty-acyl-phospholipid synthase-like methyltransferase
MDRIPEPIELMLDADQARAYGTADLSQLNGILMDEFQRHFPEFRSGRVLDLGCGTADIAIRFADAYPDSTVVGIDGSPAMLDFAREAISARGLAQRIDLRLGYLPDIAHEAGKFDVVVANSLLHHLSDPSALWDTIRACAAPGSAVMAVDLIRPADPEEARALVEKYAGRGHPLVQEDFFNSLCAAYTVENVRSQLQQAEWTGITVEAVSELQWVAHGRAS